MTPALVAAPQAVLGVAFVLLTSCLIALEATLGGRRAAWVVAAQAAAVGLFAALSAHLLGIGAAGSFLAGWVIEQALSVDNLFVFLLIFKALKVQPAQQSRALRWGIAGAALMRTCMVLAGLVLLQKVAWALPAFGLLLAASGAHVMWSQWAQRPASWGGPAQAAPTAAHPPASLVWLQQHLQVVTDAPANAFYCRRAGRLRPTTLWLALLACELADVVFAVDSVPAVLSVVQVPMLALAANLFAVMGLRSLYGLLSDKVANLRFLEPALGTILLFIGSKMIFHRQLQMGPATQVLVVAALFALAIAASLRWPHKPKRAAVG